MGDLLAQPCDEGGLALGTVTTSVGFLGAILALIVYLTIDQRRKLNAANDEGVVYAEDVVHEEEGELDPEQ